MGDDSSWSSGEPGESEQGGSGIIAFAELAHACGDNRQVIVKVVGQSRRCGCFEVFVQVGVKISVPVFREDVLAFLVQEADARDQFLAFSG